MFIFYLFQMNQIVKCSGVGIADISDTRTTSLEYYSSTVGHLFYVDIHGVLILRINESQEIEATM